MILESVPSEMELSLPSNRLSNPLSAITRHRTLLVELTRRDILGRYKGASFGMVWTILTPFMMLLIYTMAFGYIMKGRWPGGGNSTLDFALILFVGLTLHGFFGECVTRAATLISGNANLVKRVIFPLDALGWSLVLSALFHMSASVMVLLLMKLYAHGSLPWMALLLPVVILPFFLFVLGMVWIFSAIGAYFKDISQIVGVLSPAMLFLSSAIIPVESVPESYRAVFVLNPLTPPIELTRQVLIWGTLPDWGLLAKYCAFSLTVFFAGYLFFQRLRSGFADVL